MYVDLVIWGTNIYSSLLLFCTFKYALNSVAACSSVKHSVQGLVKDKCLSDCFLKEVPWNSYTLLIRTPPFSVAEMHFGTSTVEWCKYPEMMFLASTDANIITVFWLNVKNALRFRYAGLVMQSLMRLMSSNECHENL